jgi:predicted esterase
VLDIPGMRAAFEANRLGQATPTAPVYLYHAVHDRYPPIADVDRLVDTYRHDGAAVTYRRCRVGGHLTVAVSGVPGSLRFLGARLTDGAAP